MEHYENLLKYTKHNVKRRKIQAELTWWKQELEKDMAKMLKARERLIMSNEKSLCCDVCEATHFETVIIEKPKRFALQGKVHDLSVTNTDGRASDNICLECLSEMIDNYGI